MLSSINMRKWRLWNLRTLCKGIFDNTVCVSLTEMSLTLFKPSPQGPVHEFLGGHLWLSKIFSLEYLQHLDFKTQMIISFYTVPYIIHQQCNSIFSPQLSSWYFQRFFFTFSRSSLPCIVIWSCQGGVKSTQWGNICYESTHVNRLQKKSESDWGLSRQIYLQFTKIILRERKDILSLL